MVENYVRQLPFFRTRINFTPKRSSRRCSGTKLCQTTWPNLFLSVSFSITFNEGYKESQAPCPTAANMLQIIATACPVRAIHENSNRIVNNLYSKMFTAPPTIAPLAILQTESQVYPWCQTMLSKQPCHPPSC